MTEQATETVTKPAIPEVLSCAVCRGPLPAKRAYARTRYTCSPECRNALRAFQKLVVDAKYCHVCMRPSTPEEREEFKAFRRSKGQLKGERGRPPVKRTKLLEDALREAIGIVNSHIVLNPAGPTGEWARKNAEFQILLDGGAANGSTLAACGQAAEKAEEVQGDR